MISSHLIGLAVPSYLIGLAVLVGLAVGWVAVQRAWARAFPDAFDDPDVLAGRSGCHGCACATPCQYREATKESS